MASNTTAPGLLVGAVMIGPWRSVTMHSAGEAGLILLGSVLGGLPAEQSGELLRRATRRPFRAGDVLFRKGDPGTSMLLLLHGNLKVVAYSAEGREVILNLLGPGSVIGEIALFDGEPRTADVVANEPGEALVIERRAFSEVVEHSPRVALHFLALLSQKLRRTSELAEVLALLPLEARLARLLLAMAAPGRQSHVDLKGAGLSQRDLAARIGVSREAVNRQLRAWAEEGLIELPPGRIDQPLLGPGAELAVHRFPRDADEGLIELPPGRIELKEPAGLRDLAQVET